MNCSYAAGYRIEANCRPMTPSKPVASVNEALQLVNSFSGKPEEFQQKRLQRRGGRTTTRGPYVAHDGVMGDGVCADRGPVPIARPMPSHNAAGNVGGALYQGLALWVLPIPAREPKIICSSHFVKTTKVGFP